MIRIGMQKFGGGSSGAKGANLGGGNANGAFGNTDKMGFKDSDTQGYHQLYNRQQYYQQQGFDDPTMTATKAALQEYVKADPVPGTLYSPSQHLNHAMKMGYTLSPSQQQMKNDIAKGMHNIGYNLTLQRYARTDFMDNLSSVAGVNLSRFYNMKESSLQKALVGKSFTELGYISTSCNNFSKAPNGGRPFTDKVVKINYNAPAKTQALMPMFGKGGDLGEMILNSGLNYTITGVRFTGKQGRSGANYYKQIELDIDIL